MTTKAQHFVWRNYLKRWTNEGNSQGKIFVYNKNPVGNQPQFPDNPVLLTNVGFGKYYYDVTGFTEKDVVLLEKLIAHMQRYQPVQMDINPDVLSEANNHRDFIEEILGQYENIDNRHDFLGRITENDLSFYKDSFAQNVMNKLRDEMLQRILFQEITHSDEDLWKDFLNGMNHVSDEDLKHEFLRFFFVQYFRSPVRMTLKKEALKILRIYIRMN